MCDGVTNTYGSQYKTAANKTKPSRLLNILPNNQLGTTKNTLNQLVKNLYLTDPNTAHKLTPAPLMFINIRPPVISKPEFNRIIRNIKQNKAPSFDYINYNLVNRIHKAAPQLFLTLFNMRLNHNYFPTSLKIGTVVLFHNAGKEPQNPKIYRRICLLPAFSKILEHI